jgi:hypothetical protein
MSPRRGSTPRHTDWLTVSCNVTLTLTEVRKVENEVSFMHRRPIFPGKESPFDTRLTGPQIRSGNKEFPVPFYTYEIGAGISQSVYLRAGWPGLTPGRSVASVPILEPTQPMRWVPGALLSPGKSGLGWGQDWRSYNLIPIRLHGIVLN